MFSGEWFVHWWSLGLEPRRKACNLSHKNPALRTKAKNRVHDFSHLPVSHFVHVVNNVVKDRFDHKCIVVALIKSAKPR